MTEIDLSPNRPPQAFDAWRLNGLRYASPVWPDPFQEEEHSLRDAREEADKKRLRERMERESAALGEDRDRENAERRQRSWLARVAGSLASLSRGGGSEEVRSAGPNDGPDSLQHDLEAIHTLFTAMTGGFDLSSLGESAIAESTEKPVVSDGDRSWEKPSRVEILRDMAKTAPAGN